MGPLVTVIMPVYNGEVFLGVAIESVLSQTYHNFELIILDDGSTDRSLDIIRGYQNEDSRIRVVSRENKGLCVSLNELLDLAKSDIVFMMHADDEMMPERLERQEKYLMMHPEIDICSSYVEYIDDKGKNIGRYSVSLSPKRAQALAAKNKIIGFNHPSTVFRRKLIQVLGGYRQEFWPCEDIDLWNRAIEIGAGIYTIPEYLLKYRIHGASASVARSKLLRRKHHFVKECMLCRRRNSPELSWDAFIDVWEGRTFGLRLNTWRKDTAKALYKNAVFLYSQRRYLGMVLFLIEALLLQPVYVTRQIVSKYGK
jgi:glycosyltransferase involved in cell wall biosynthesis